MKVNDNSKRLTLISARFFIIELSHYQIITLFIVSVNILNAAFSSRVAFEKPAGQTDIPFDGSYFNTAIPEPKQNCQ